MISECFNPVCRKKLEYLRTGKVIQVVRGHGKNVEIEHFWLCGECQKTHDLRVLPNGDVTLSSRAVRPSLGSARRMRWAQEATEMTA